MTKGMSLGAATIVAALVAMTAPAPARANARISGLVDVNYGTIANFADQTISQNVCVYSVTGNSSNRRPYSVLATGNGSAGAFTLQSGARTLPYEVRWNDAADQTSGTQLTNGVNASGFLTGNVNLSCSNGANNNASLVVTITGTSLATATAGTYTGVLTIVITPN
jgi:hypothetical protein